MDAPEKRSGFHAGRGPSLIEEAEHDEKLATDYTRVASYMADHGKPLAADLFLRLSRHHAVRALEKRARAAAHGA